MKKLTILSFLTSLLLCSVLPSYALDVRGGATGATGTGCTTLGGDLSGPCSAAVVEQATPSTGTFTVNGAETLDAVGGFSLLNMNTDSGHPWLVFAFPSGQGTGTTLQLETSNGGISGVNFYDNADTQLPDVMQLYGLILFDNAGSNNRTFASLPASPLAGMFAYVNDLPTNNLGDIITTGGGTLEGMLLYDGNSPANWVVVGTRVPPATVASVTAITPLVSNAVSATPQNAVGCADTQVTITGAATTMACVASPAGTLNVADVNVEASCYVSASNTVQLHLCTIVVSTGAAQNYNIRVIP